MGILTEEELKQLEYENEKSFVRMLDVRKLINSHRNLLSANAELTNKNLINEQDLTKLAHAINLIIPLCTTMEHIKILDVLQPIIADLFLRRVEGKQ